MVHTAAYTTGLKEYLMIAMQQKLKATKIQSYK
jgi:hypothetical protein